MTRMESALLDALGPTPKPPCVLYREVTGQMPVNVDEVIRAHVANIRHKLTEYGLDKAIVTIRGRGYLWSMEAMEGNVRWADCAWCHVTFAQERRQSRRPYRYCEEHRHHTYRHRLSWLRKRAS